MLRATGMDHHRPSGEQGFTAPIADLAQFPRHLLNHQLDPALTGDTGRHEAELIRSRLTRFGFAYGANTADPGDHGFAQFEIAQQLAAGNHTLSGFRHGDRAVHTLTLHPHPMTLDANFRRINRRHVEIIGRHTRHFDRHEVCILLILRTRFRTEVD